VRDRKIMSDQSVNWRTVQMFLGEEGVSEVEVDADNAFNVKCSCQSYGKFKKCKHATFVLNKIEANDGHYGVQIPDTIDDEIAMAALNDEESFRDFVIRYGKIEVL
jgi:hypothetical protein